MVRQLAAGLARSGIETHVATTDDNGPTRLRVPFGRPIEQDGVTYWYFPRQTRFYTFSWPMSLWLSRHVDDFDLVHIHALFSYATLPAAFFAYRHDVPYVVRPLGTLNEWGMQNRRPWLKRLSFRLLESRVIQRAAVVHYTSDQERTEAEKLHVSGHAAVIPNAVPDSRARRTTGAFRAGHPWLRGRRIVLFLSRLDRKKGLDLLLQGFVRSRRHSPEAALVIAGDGQPEYVAALKRQAESLGIAGDVLWTGFLEGENKDAAMADADVFVLPSYSENFGIAVAEAMAAGLPVIVTDQVGIYRDVAEARAGLVVRCDAGELSQALVRLLCDSTLRTSMGRNAKRLATAKYSQSAVTGKIIDVYNGIVRARPIDVAMCGEVGA
jgi:glycosyltransferase involved in cell wall biosynthesis